LGQFKISPTLLEEINSQWVIQEVKLTGFKPSTLLVKRINGGWSVSETDDWFLKRMKLSQEILFVDNKTIYNQPFSMMLKLRSRLAGFRCRLGYKSPSTIYTVLQQQLDEASAHVGGSLW